MRARLFPFSLHGKALRWFHTLPVESKQDGSVDEELYKGTLFTGQDSKFVQQD
jgi:hypothetical protein